jgi:hypothetical protein
VHAPFINFQSLELELTISKKELLNDEIFKIYEYVYHKNIYVTKYVIFLCETFTGE